MNPMMINTALKSLFLKKVSKVNNKASKLGMAPVDIEFGATVELDSSPDKVGAYKVQDSKGRNKWVALYTEVTIVGDAPVIDGWKLIAVVDLRGEKPMVREVPFVQNSGVSKYFDTDCRCDHCNTLRARNDVLVIENAEGEQMQLGRNCAADFFGTSDATQRLSVCDWIDAYDETGESIPRGEQSVGVARMYAVAAAVVRTFGWVSHRDVEFDNTLTSTRSRVWANLFPWPQMPAEDKVTVTEKDEAEAEVVMQWLNDKFLSVEDGNDFQRKVQASVEGDNVPYVRLRNLNMLIWGIAGYQRDLQKDAEKRRIQREKLKQAGQSDYVGTVGERREFRLTLQFKRGFGSEFGVKYLQKFVDEDGNVIVWWGTNDVSAQTVVGNTYLFKATIKGHDEYEGVKQTCLTRAALIEGELQEDE